MSDVKLDELHKHDKVLFTRIMPKLGYYEIHDCVVATLHNVLHDNSDYCTVCDTKTKQSFLIHKPRVEEVLFRDRRLALEYLEEEKRINKDVKVYKE